MQLDLFLDSHDVMLANEAGEALLARDVRRALARVGELDEEAPDYPALPALKALARALEHWGPPAPDHAVIARCVGQLAEEVAPAARAALGPRAATFLGPFYHALADAASALPYESRYPQAHRAPLCLLAGDYDGTERAALGIPGWADHPDALRWLSIARYRRDGLDAARATVFQLAWRAPAAVPALLAALDDSLLLREWHAFEAASAWESVAEGELAAWFPAWYLNHHPASAGELRTWPLPDTQGARAVRLLLRLLDLERQADVRALAAGRAELRGVNPDLFALYMARRAVLHP